MPPSSCRNVLSNAYGQVQGGSAGSHQRMQSGRLPEGELVRHVNGPWGGRQEAADSERCEQTLWSGSKERLEGLNLGSEKG